MDGFSPSSLYHINHSNGITRGPGRGNNDSSNIQARVCKGRGFVEHVGEILRMKRRSIGLKKIPKLDIPRNPRRICGIDPDDMDFVGTTMRGTKVGSVHGFCNAVKIAKDVQRTWTKKVSTIKSEVMSLWHRAHEK